MLISLFTEFKDNLILFADASPKKSFFVFFKKLMIVSQHVTGKDTSPCVHRKAFTKLVPSFQSTTIMKAVSVIFFFIFLIAAASCGKKDGAPPAGEPIDSEPNQLLEKEAWRIHDEVMPKMGRLYKLKGTLQEKITSTPDMPEDEKAELQTVINELDASYEGMMQWMRNFKPEQHASSEENTREYLENEIENIKKVREDILAALEKGESAAAP